MANDRTVSKEQKDAAAEANESNKRLAEAGKASAARFNQNLNKPNIADEDLPEYEGVKVVKILRASIAEDGAFYQCVMDDGTIKPVPMSAFESSQE